jgi:hypothetical protein
MLHFLNFKDCFSAKSEKSVGGELFGLTRGFLSAGARGLITTLWEIRDNITPFLMFEFVKQFNQGIPFSKALHIAKKEMSTKCRKRDWGCFLYLGDFNQSLSSPLLKEIGDEQVAVKIPDWVDIFQKTSAKVKPNRGSDIKDSDIKILIDAFPMLEEIDLTSCTKLTDQTVEHLGSLFNLQKVQIDDDSLISSAACEWIKIYCKFPKS